MAVVSEFLTPSRTVADAREAFSEPLDVAREVRRRLTENGQRDSIDATRSFISAARVVGERQRDRTGVGFGTDEERAFTAITFAVDQLEEN